jgi:diaminopimelate decarboxylase
MSNSDLEMEAILTHIVVEKNLINDSCPSIDLFDIDYFRDRMSGLIKAFPESFFLHAMALKANSMRGVLRLAMEAGLGGECASLPEAIHALSIGLPPEKVVFDSPCKTRVSLVDFRP